MFAVNAKPFGTTMASYTADQVQKFRQIFRERSTDEGLSLEEFQPAVEECLRSAGLPEPPSHYLSSEFRRLSTTGTVPWQQFFQVSSLALDAVESQTFGVVKQYGALCMPVLGV